MATATEQRVLLANVGSNGTAWKSITLPEPCKTDGGMYLATPMDPLFILLPVLDAARFQGGGGTSEDGVFSAYDQLTDQCQPQDQAVIRQILDAHQEALPCVCDIKDVGGDKYYRLSGDRVLAWMMAKICQCKEALISQVAGLSDDAKDAYAAGFLSEYLPTKWSEALYAHLKVDMAAQSAPGSQRAITQPPEKRQKLDPKELAKQAAKRKADEAKAALAAKQAAGMKKISAFFVPKAK